MYLIEDPKWVSVRVGDRVIIPADRKLYPSITWHYLLCHQLVELTQTPHRYRAILSAMEVDAYE